VVGGGVVVVGATEVLLVVGIGSAMGLIGTSVCLFFLIIR
jgi:hypothetical protein